MIKNKQIAYEIAEDILEKIVANLLDEGVDLESLMWDKDTIKGNLIETIMDSFKEYGVI